MIGTGSRNLDFVRELGVDQAIDYSVTPFENVVQDVDVVLDTVGGDTHDRSWAVLKPGGILVSVIQAPSQEAAEAHGVRAAMVASSPPIGKVLTELAEMVDSGKIRPHVSVIFPLEQMREAHRTVEGKHARGKVGILVNQ